MAGHQNFTYLPATVISAMQVVIHTAQYVQPLAKPANTPRNSSAYSDMLPDTGRYTSNSPRARMMMKIAKPAARYPRIRAGPAFSIAPPAP